MQIDINQDPIVLYILAQNYDGSIKDNVVSGTVRVYFIDSGVKNDLLGITSLIEISNGEWIYEWSPISINVGQYIIEYNLLGEVGENVTVLDNLVITDSNNVENINFQYVATDTGINIELGVWVEGNGEVLKDITSIALQIYDLQGNLINDLGINTVDTTEGVFYFTMLSTLLSSLTPYYLNIDVVRGSITYEANLGLSVAS